MTTVRHHVVTATDGVRLAVQERGPRNLPTIVLVHGYPDDHHVWDGVVPLLTDRFHVVTYDVRGAGSSERPRRVRSYRIGQLVEDLRTVLDLVSPGSPVHLLAHDWGSIQTWGAVTDPTFADRLLSYTSISGPDLDMVGVWLRKPHGHPGAWLRQLRDSYYVALFQIPVIPEYLARVVDAVARHSTNHGMTEPAGRGRSHADIVDGIKLYRANFLPRLSLPRPRRAVVPVQVLAPRGDLHVDCEMAMTVPAPYVDELRTHLIEGNHWVVENDPELIAHHVTTFVDQMTGKADLALF